MTRTPSAFEATVEVQHAARDLLGYYGFDGGYGPGGFTTKLIRCWESADAGNRARLALAFPAMAVAISALTESRAALYRLAWPVRPPGGDD